MRHRTNGLTLLVLIALSGSVAADEITPRELALVKQAEQTRIRAVEQVYNTVVAIYPKVQRGGGSGVVIDEDGFLLTNNHVMMPVGPEGKGGLADGKLYKLTFIGTDPGGDVAIARLHGKPSFDFAKLGDSNAVNVGDFCLAMGNPFMLAEDQRPTVTLGIISGVGRYQHGQGNIGVYGNCLQFDTSINPGNSGGPLFDLSGRVVGINGRGSFEERGRVNVGLGYAISMEQIKNFIPDLRAAKLCMHGTLDAVFTDRDGKVVCDEVNLDSAIAKTGMELGDPILALDGRRIFSANQLAGLISMYPAKWPVEVTFEHKGRRKVAWVRLRPLPYQMPQRPPGARPMPIRPGNLPATRPAGTRPATGPATQPFILPVGPALLPTTRPGDIRDMKLNREECERILKKWRAFSNENKVIGDGKALHVIADVFEGGKKSRRISGLRDATGRYRAEVVDGALAGAPTAWGWDGTSFWIRESDGKVTRDLEPRKRREVAQAMLWGAVQQESIPTTIREIVLEGGDLAQRQRAYRVRVVDDAGHRMLLWFSVFAEDNATFQVRLLKRAFESAGNELDPIWTFGDYRPLDGMMIPHRVRQVKGLPEDVESELVTTSCKVVDAPPGSLGAPDAKSR